MPKSFSQNEQAIEQYAMDTFQPEDDVLLEIRQRAAHEGLPDIHVSPMDGLHLEVIARAAGARKIVEIGTLAGYSGVCLARALPKGGKLYCFEFSPLHAEVSEESFRKAGVADKTQIFIGSALETLPKIKSEGPFDLVFIDADKPGYPAYLDWTVENLRVGGVFLADNTFAHGLIADPAAASGPRAANVKAIRQFNQKAAQNLRFRATILPTGEGLTMGVKIR